MVKIRRAMVKDSNENWILKNYARNDTSSRDIPMPKFIIDLLPDTGMAVSINLSQITHRHEAALKKLQIPYFRFHDLRHTHATVFLLSFHLFALDFTNLLWCFNRFSCTYSLNYTQISIECGFVVSLA